MRNYRTKIACATGALTLAMAMPALADSDHQVTRQLLSEADRIAIFGKDSNFQVALLTEDEMAETKGAFWPFTGNWITRLAVGAFYGSMSWGWDVMNSPYEYGSMGIRTLWGHYVLMYSIANLLNSNHVIGGAVGIVVDKAGGVDAVDAMVAGIRTKMIEAEWTVRDLLERVGTATDRIIADHLQGQEGDGGSADSLSAEPSALLSEDSDSESFDANRYLVNLTDSLDRVSLRQFLSNSIPIGTLNIILARVAPKGTSRQDFLANLPTDTVNRVLLELSEDLMSLFLEDVVPQTLQDSISVAMAGDTLSDSTTTLDVHWVY